MRLINRSQDCNPHGITLDLYDDFGSICLANRPVEQARMGPAIHGHFDPGTPNKREVT